MPTGNPQINYRGGIHPPLSPRADRGPYQGGLRPPLSPRAFEVLLSAPPRLRVKMTLSWITTPFPRRRP